MEGRHEARSYGEVATPHFQGHISTEELTSSYGQWAGAGHIMGHHRGDGGALTTDD